LAFVFIIRLVLPSQGRIAFIGGILAVLGGLFRALWKLLLAGLLSGGILRIVFVFHPKLFTAGWLFLVNLIGTLVEEDWRGCRNNPASCIGAMSGFTCYCGWDLPLPHG
jgi:hypothetical protein